MTILNRSVSIVVVGVTLAGASLCLGSIIARTRSVPIARLIENTCKYVDEHPNDPEGFFVLGRLHAMTFVLKSRTTLETTSWHFKIGRPFDGIPPHSFWRKGPQSEPLSHDELLSHLTESIRQYEKAIELSSAIPIARQSHMLDRANLRLGYILHKGADFSGEVAFLPSSSVDDPAIKKFAEEAISKLGDSALDVRSRTTERFLANIEATASVLHLNRDHADSNVRNAVRGLLRTYWRERAIHHYLASYEISGMRGLLAGSEAGEAYIGLVLSRGIRNEEEAKRVREINAILVSIPEFPAPKHDRRNQFGRRASNRNERDRRGN